MPRRNGSSKRANCWDNLIRRTDSKLMGELFTSHSRPLEWTKLPVGKDRSVICMKSSSGNGCFMSEEEVALRHGKHCGSLRAQNLAIGSHDVGFWIHLDIGSRGVVHHVAFTEGSGISHGHGLSPEAELSRQTGFRGGPGQEGERRRA